MENQSGPEPGKFSPPTSIDQPKWQCLRSMTLLPRSPSPNPIVCPYEVLFYKNSVISVGDTPYHFSIHVRTPVPTSVMRTQWVGKGSRRRRVERWREWPRRAFGEEGVSGIEVERGFGFLIEDIGWQGCSLARRGDCGWGSDPSLLRGRFEDTASDSSSHTSYWQRRTFRGKDRCSRSRNFLIMIEQD